MVKIKLNQNIGDLTQSSSNFKLDPKIRYIINIENESQEIYAQQLAIKTMGLGAITDYYNWLESNPFDSNFPNPTNAFVKKYYGNNPLWITKLSQGIVMKAEDDDDFYIVMECSRENPGFKYSQIILTPGGCM